MKIEKIIDGILFVLGTLGVLFLYEKFIDKPDTVITNKVGKMKNKNTSGSSSNEMSVDINDGQEAKKTFKEKFKEKRLVRKAKREEKKEKRKIRKQNKRNT